MAAWLPLLKASLPYVTQLVTAALPAFTSKPATGKSEDVVAKQVAELQAAVTHNAESIRKLVADLKQTIEGIDAAGQALQQELKGLRRLAAATIAVAIAAVCVAVWALVKDSGA